MILVWGEGARLELAEKGLEKSEIYIWSFSCCFHCCSFREGTILREVDYVWRSAENVLKTLIW